MEKVIVYANDSCGYCKQIKDMLNSANIDFKVRLTVDFKKEWEEITSLTGMSMLPTISYKDAIFIPGRDYGNPSHLINIIETYERPSYDNINSLLEKTKTLNFNIATAFSRVDKLLMEINENTKKDEHKSTS
tara:strand:+ start:201 stop:596 length:396 start_codon:yes stop_codon:yes gene_type:complete